jgi:hypothetical protein
LHRRFRAFNSLQFVNKPTTAVKPLSLRSQALLGPVQSMRKTCFLVSSSSPSSATGAFTALAALGMLCCLACSQPGPAPQKNDAAHKLTGWQEQRLSNYLTTVMPQAHAMVKSGDLITRLGSDITSEMLRQLNQTDKSYSHCGIASIENDSVFVYHAIGGEFNPSQKIKREPLASFGHPTENKALGLFRPKITSGEKTLLLKMVKGLYHAGVPFDMDFD